MQRKGGASRVAVRRRARSGVGRTPAGPRRSLTVTEARIRKRVYNNKLVTTRALLATNTYNNNILDPYYKLP